MHIYDMWLAFDNDDAQKIVDQILRRSVKVNFDGRTMDEQYDGFTGEFRAYLDGLAMFLGRDCVVALIEDAQNQRLSEMTGVVT